MTNKEVISLEDLVRREVVCCVSILIYALTQDLNVLDEELAIELWTGPISNDGYQREIVGHWIVSDWLGRKLKEKGQTVAEDVYNLAIWAIIIS